MVSGFLSFLAVDKDNERATDDPSVALSFTETPYKGFAKNLSPDLCGRGFSMFVFLLVFLPHGEFAVSGESGLDSQKRQYPAIEDIPCRDDGEKYQ